MLEVVFWLCSPARSEEGVKTAIQVACRRGWRHDHRMERDRTKPPTPDLFSTHVVPDDTVALRGVEHHTFVCSECRVTEERVVFIKDGRETDSPAHADAGDATRRACVNRAG